jgi:hypothetical protein
LGELKTCNKFSRLEINPKWHVEEVRGCEANLLHVKRLVLGGVKRMINVVNAHNKEAITIESKCNITFEDFQNVHTLATQQLLVNEEALKVVWKLVVSSSMQRNLKGLEDLLCQKIDNIEVQLESNAINHGSNMVPSSVFQSKLRA